MYLIVLKLSDNKRQASAFMESHDQWIKRGFDDGVFLLTGSLQPGLGGTVIANGESRKALETRVRNDPFVAENIVSAEILEIEPRMADERLSFLLDRKPGDYR